MFPRGGVPFFSGDVTIGTTPTQIQSPESGKAGWFWIRNTSATVNVRLVWAASSADAQASTNFIEIPSTPASPNNVQSFPLHVPPRANTAMRPWLLTAAGTAVVNYATFNSLSDI